MEGDEERERMRTKEMAGSTARDLILKATYELSADKPQHSSTCEECSVGSGYQGPATRGLFR